MSLMDKFSSSFRGEASWKVGDDKCLYFSSKKVKSSPQGYKIEVYHKDHKVTGESHLAMIIRELANNKSLSTKLQSLKENDSVRVVIGNNDTEYRFSTPKTKSTTERTESAASKQINKLQPPPLPPRPKRKPQVSDEQLTGDMWQQLQDKGSVDL